MPQMRDWAAMPDRATPAEAAVRPPVALTIAVVVVVVETAFEVAFVFGRDDYGPGGKVLITMVLASKILLALSARRLRAGGALGLLLFELVGILVAVGAGWSLALRLGLVACVVAVYFLVLSSLHAFPPPELP